MANPTTNFGWVMPTSASLVTNLPADFNVFGQGVDTSMQYLLGGTTGQILSKTSGTNMAFTWIANDQGDITGVTAGTGISVTSPTGPVPTVAIDTAVTVDKTTAQTLTNKTLTSPALTTPTISTATTNGDILYGTGSGALARLGIGSSAQVLTVASGIPSWATPASAGGTWAAWTPTFTNLTVGNGTLTSRYATVGKIVFMSLKFVLGSTSSIGSGVSITWPVTPASTEAAQTGQMSVWIQDISSGAFLSTIAAYERTTSIFKLTNVYVSGTQIGADSGFTSTSPFTWATGDLIWFSGSYESV